MTVRVLHYVNQFFGGIGGEEHSETPVQTVEGPVGPGRALQQALGDRGTVVATVICGDDYVAEREDDAAPDMAAALEKYSPDLVIAGPAFDSGRYGLGCALMCRVAKSKDIPAVTGMYPDNAAIITHRLELLAVPSGNDASQMMDVLGRMANLGLKLASGAELGSAEDEGYIPHGIRTLVFKERVGYERALDMLLARVNDDPWKSEIQIQQYETISPAAPIEDLTGAKIGIVVSTGVVPKGNPDSIPGARALYAGRYSIDDIEALDIDGWESVHGGFNTRILNLQNPNYALPLPALRILEADGVIGSVYPHYFSTVGNQTAIGLSIEIGQRIVKEFLEEGVDAVIQVSG